jgi:hypothetical protein
MFTMTGSADRWGLAIFQIASLLCLLIFSSQAQASLKDGSYPGLYKVIWVGSDTDSKIGDKGKFFFEIKDSKLVGINVPGDDVINRAKFRSKVFIEEEKMVGDIYLDIVEQGYPITVKMAVDGVVADGAFIGKATISLISVNGSMMGDTPIEKFIFESN